MYFPGSKPQKSVIDVVTFELTAWAASMCILTTVSVVPTNHLHACKILKQTSTTVSDTRTIESVTIKEYVSSEKKTSAAQ